MSGFWAFLAYVNHLTGQCGAIAGDGIPGTGSVPEHVVYAGNCAQAFLVALFDRALFWVYS